ncbi:MAG TPA: hypothetical protein VF971_04535 [Candidatus Limnocylindrales bacterium]
MAARKAAAQPDGTDPQPRSDSPAPKRPRSRRPAVTAAPGSGPSTAPESTPSPAAPVAVMSGEILDAPAVHEDGSWVEADAVEVHQGAIGRAEATDIRLTQGAIGLARGDRVSVVMGGVGAALGSEVSVSQAGVGSVLAQRATVDQAVVRTLVAQEVEFRKPSGVLVLIAQRVSGDVRVLLDWRAALAFGAAFGALFALLGRGRRGR